MKLQTSPSAVRGSPRPAGRPRSPKDWPLRRFLMVTAALFLLYIWMQQPAGSSALSSQQGQAAVRRLSLHTIGAERSSLNTQASDTPVDGAARVEAATDAAADGLVGGALAAVDAGSLSRQEGDASEGGIAQTAAAASSAEEAAAAAASVAEEQQPEPDLEKPSEQQAEPQPDKQPEQQPEQQAKPQPDKQPEQQPEEEAEPQPDHQAEQQAGGAGGGAPPLSPFELALSGCDSLACIREAHKQPKHPGQFNFPHFYILGFPKCATTSLYHHLIQHPQVMAPRIKEPNFFTSRCNDSAVGCSLHEQRKYINDTLHLPIALAARLSMAVFEGSTHNSLAGEWLAAELRELMPWVKLVISMREPISRAISMLQHNLDHDRLPKCYDAKRRLIFRCIQDKLAEGSLRYGPRLRAWVEHFPPEQLHILQYENLTADARTTRAALRDLKRFVGVTARLPSDDLGLHNSRRDNYATGWAMTRREYSALVDLARADAEDVLDVVKRHGFAVAGQWMANWERAWQDNLARCESQRGDAQCMIPAT